MRYRIVELIGGKFKVQMKYNFFDFWDNLYTDFDEYADAEKYVQVILKDDAQRKENKRNKKIKRIVKVFK